ncbi:MAG: glycosyltransferase family 2 protein [Bacteroidia bacterium]|nr:glycosyltransferase family 2 protein [Bacteroidia bacterium]
MTPISAVIITYNEEKNIARCLDSLQGVVDEIIVLDSFSKDSTEAICRERGAKFFQHAFDGHIEQKNRAITYASHPHVLSLDADEALDETLRKSIIEVKKHFTADGYSMNRLTNYCGHWVRYCGWYPDTKLRLWDSGKGRWTGINPHDKYELFSGGKEEHLKGDILHYSYYTRDDHYKQIEYFTNIAAKAYQKEGRKAGWLVMYLSAVAKFLRDYIIKLGFLDGGAGFAISRISAYAAYLKYKKLRALNKGG